MGSIDSHQPTYQGVSLVAPNLAYLGYRGLRGRVQPMLHLFMVHQSRLLRDGMAAVKNGEVGNAAHIEARGQLRITLGIHLNYNRTSRHIRSGSRNFRSGHPARAAPGCPKIDQHRDASLLDDLVEQLRIYFERLGCGTQWNFADAAASRIRKMVSGDAVLASTRLAGSQDGQEHLLPTFHLQLRAGPARRKTFHHPIASW